MADPSTNPTASNAGAVTGVFQDRASLIRAVEALSEKSVPSDSIRVFVESSAGDRRDIPVEDESGTLRGAVVGAGVGGLAGLLVALAAGTGLLGPVGVELVSFRGLAGVVPAVLGGAAAAVPLGALLGMSYWQGRKRLSGADFETGRAMVVVDSRELSELARQTLEEAGATEISGG